MNNDFKVAILGYGSQGRAWAQNLSDSGVSPVIGLPDRSKSRKLAKTDGMVSITSPRKAVQDSDIIIFAFPDHLHGKIYNQELIDSHPQNTALLFLHGFSIHFRSLLPRDDTDIILLAPLGPGTAVREKYLENSSIGYFYSIHNDSSAIAKKKLEFLVKKMKIDRSRMIETSFADEAIGDLFGEQAVLCGGLTQLIKSGYETLVENGLDSDKAYLEVAYQLDLIVDLVKKYGIEGMYNRISMTARYGSVENGPKIIDDSVKKKMQRIYKEIASGKFAEKFSKADRNELNGLQDKIRSMTTPTFEKSSLRFSDNKSKKKLP